LWGDVVEILDISRGGGRWEEAGEEGCDVVVCWWRVALEHFTWADAHVVVVVKREASRDGLGNTAG